MQYRRLATPPPLERMTSGVWWHGTPWYKSYQGIRREGLRVGKMVNYKEDDVYYPMEGMIYITQIFRVAVEFALGTYMSVYHSERTEPYGYVFKFNGDDLEDVYLNEDILGLALTVRFPDSGSPQMVKYIEGLRTRFTDTFGFSHPYQGTHKEVKEFWNELTEEDHAKLLELYDVYKTNDFNESVAHKGVLKPVACWRFNKNAVQESTYDVAYGNAPDDNPLFKKVF